MALFHIFPATEERKVLGRETSVLLKKKRLIQQEGKPDLEVYDMPAKGREFINAFHTPENIEKVKGRLAARQKASTTQPTKTFVSDIGLRGIATGKNEMMFLEILTNTDGGEKTDLLISRAGFPDEIAGPEVGDTVLIYECTTVRSMSSPILARCIATPMDTLPM